MLTESELAQIKQDYEHGWLNSTVGALLADVRTLRRIVEATSKIHPISVGDWRIMCDIHGKFGAYLPQQRAEAKYGTD